MAWWQPSHPPSSASPPRLPACLRPRRTCPWRAEACLPRQQAFPARPRAFLRPLRACPWRAEACLPQLQASPARPRAFPQPPRACPWRPEACLPRPQASLARQRVSPEPSLPSPPPPKALALRPPVLPPRLRAWLPSPSAVRCTPGIAAGKRPLRKRSVQSACSRLAAYRRPSPKTPREPRSNLPGCLSGRALRRRSLQQGGSIARRHIGQRELGASKNVSWDHSINFGGNAPARLLGKSMNGPFFDFSRLDVSQSKKQSLVKSLPMSLWPLANCKSAKSHL